MGRPSGDGSGKSRSFAKSHWDPEGSSEGSESTEGDVRANAVEKVKELRGGAR